MNQTVLRVGSTGPGPEVQPFGTVRPMFIGLSPEASGESASLLNEILADSFVIYALYRKHHWLVRGHTFHQLHLLFDQHAEEQAQLIDQLAERVQALGAVAVTDPRHVAEVTRIPRPPDGVEPVPAMLNRLLSAHASVIETTRAAIEATALSLDWGTNDLLVGDVLRPNEQQAWFITEHVSEEVGR